jgi:hypothetical protein
MMKEAGDRDQGLGLETEFYYPLILRPCLLFIIDHFAFITSLGRNLLRRRKILQIELGLGHLGPPLQVEVKSPP